MIYPTGRPLIYMSEGKVCHYGTGPARVVIRGDKISVGCTDFEPAVLEYMHKRWTEFKRRNVEEVVQE